MLKNKTYSSAQLNKTYIKLEKSMQKSKRAEQKVEKYNNEFCNIAVNNLAKTLSVKRSEILTAVKSLLDKIKKQDEKIKQLTHTAKLYRKTIDTTRDEIQAKKQQEQQQNNDMNGFNNPQSPNIQG